MIVLVGGQSRKAGKTALVEAIIRATPEASWTAMKITPHAHDGAPESGDTGRYVRAGAARALLLADVDEIAAAVAPPGNYIVESNSAARVLEPEVAIFVSDPANAEVKASAEAFLRLPQVLVVSDAASAELAIETVRGRVGNRDGPRGF